uniref:Zinc finger, CCHC-type n=1 Tax=Tanacetum cinerariifolium TaxID=118510 RepID=A0A699HK87_TANCI|nr:zinc finger, CCHC-type [Tanacetum cinerariifolium]
MLLTSLPPSYDNFVETLLYERESLALEDVLSSLNSRELKKRIDAKDDGDGLYVRGRSDHPGNQGRGSSRSKSKGKRTYKLKCYICYSEDHLKKDYPKKNKKKINWLCQEEYGTGRDFLFDFKKFNGGTVLLGDNRACAIMGIRKAESGEASVSIQDKESLAQCGTFSGGIGTSYRLLMIIRGGIGFIFLDIRMRNLITCARMSKDEWVCAMEEEMSSLKKNHTWELVDQPPGQKLVSCKWLYKIKEGIEGVQKTKVLLSLTACEDYELEQLDVKTAFLHALGLAATATIDAFTSKSLHQKILNNYRVDNGKSVSVPLGAHFKVFLRDCSSNDLDVEKLLVGKPLGGNEVDFKVLEDTADVGLVYGRDQGKHVDIDSFVDADYAKDPDKGRSITGYVFMVHRCVVSWKATLQHVVALSTIYAKYVALTEAVKERIWLKGLLIEL